MMKSKYDRHDMSYSSSLNDAIDPPKPDNVARSGTIRVIGRVKIRSTPTMDFQDSNVITSLPDGTKIDVFNEDNGYYRIKHEGKEAYCDKRYISLDE